MYDASNDFRVKSLQGVVSVEHLPDDDDKTRASAPLKGGMMIGNYRIIEKIGAGGMGDVYRALDTKLDRPVALKFLSCYNSPGPEGTARFLDEVQALAKAAHPNIVTIYGAEEYRGDPFYVMEFVEGSTLAELMDEAPPSPDDSLRICIDVCHGLQKAHECGLVHRDINPHNILVDQDGLAKILDFGLATFRDIAHGFEAKSIAGTLKYMSPEQLQSAAVDHRSDIFSLGVVLYQLVSGRLPFDGEYEAAVSYSIINEAPSPSVFSLSDISPSLAETISKALEKKPEKRIQSAADLAKHLESILDVNRSGKSDSPDDASQGLPSIAILHFRDLSKDRDQEFFCDGIAEEIISVLAKTPEIKVASPASVSKIKGHEVNLSEIGDKLGVDTVLEGSVRKGGNRVRIATQLVDVNSGYCLWSETFDRDVADIFVVQDEISRAIAAHLKIKLTGGDDNSLIIQRTDNPEAYSQYLRGRYYWNRRYEGGLVKSIKYFQRAIELDPLYAPAYAGLADSFNIIAFYNFMPPHDACPKAKAAAKRALQLDSESAEAHTALGWIYTFYEWNFEGAEGEFKAAIRIKPSLAIAHQYYALFLIAMRRFEEGISEMRQALELDPLATIIATSFGAAHYFMRNHEQSVEEHLKALQFDPDFALAHAFLAGPYVCMERYDDAVNECLRARELASESIYPTAFLAYAYGVSGKVPEASELLEQLLDLAQSRYISSYHIALIYCGLGDSEKSIEFLERAYDERDNWMIWLNVYPVFDTLKEDHRFQDLVARVGLP